jgi:hypothetical protein
MIDVPALIGRVVRSLLIEEWPQAAARLQALINERMPNP